MPLGNNAWLTFLTFNLLIKIVFLHAAHCSNAKHSSSYNLVDIIFMLQDVEKINTRHNGVFENVQENMPTSYFGREGPVGPYMMVAKGD